MGDPLAAFADAFSIGNHAPGDLDFAQAITVDDGVVSKRGAKAVGIDTLAATQPVAAGTTVELVVAGPALDVIVAAAAVERIVAVDLVVLVAACQQVAVFTTKQDLAASRIAGVGTAGAQGRISDRIIEHQIRVGRNTGLVFLIPLNHHLQHQGPAGKIQVAEI
ncbi:hypothetical protein F1609_13160 [Massilia sp. CCM 8693]|uniref:Uncharacterized protein n=1 Tax=Massilia aquatica TaxID=2609000 RepID=A0ABX0M1Q2_9BURK|nr:hypothetical protein [Massilia aquatica]NHZ41096.1 hypothetical protein [Massilia aquatica]